MIDKEIKDLLKPITYGIGTDNSEFNFHVYNSTFSTPNLNTNLPLDYYVTVDGISDHINDWKLEQEWKDINKEAKNNEALQKAIERVKILYHLGKDDGYSQT